MSDKPEPLGAEERAKQLQNMLVRHDEDIGSITTCVNLERVIREAEDAMREETLEEACKAQCPHCSQGVKVKFWQGIWVHREAIICVAGPIRRLLLGPTAAEIRAAAAQLKAAEPPMVHLATVWYTKEQTDSLKEAWYGNTQGQGD